MPGGLSYKTKQFFYVLIKLSYVLIKLSIVIAASFFIYQKLANNNNVSFAVFIDFLLKNDSFSSKTTLFVLLLTIFSWFFEILKWQNLSSYVKNISFFEASQQSLAAHTASLFTPNKIGEYGAKAIYFIKPLRKNILLLNFLGNMAQMGCTLAFGIVGLILFVTKYNVDISYYKLILS